MSLSAVLIVRHLSDPLPGQLAPSSTAVRAPLAWESAVKREMGRLYRTAARPIRGELPLNPTAVLFADEAEMMACLALDIARGLAFNRWWWQALSRARPTLRLNDMPCFLLQQPRLLPGLLACLQSWQKTSPVLKKLSDSETTSILSAVSQTFHLPPLPPIESASQPEAASEETVPAVVPPWQPFLPPPAIPEALSPAQVCLLGLSLSLNHRPAAGATPAYIQQLHRWWQAETRPAPPTASPTPASSSPEQTLIQTADPPAGQPPKNGAHSEKSLAPKLPAEPEQSTPTTGPLSSHPVVTAVDEAAPSPPTPAIAQQETAAPPVQTPQPELDAALEDGQLTRLGGILYLVNLMTRFDLPACFEAGWALSSQLGAWGTLELLARGLLAEVQSPPIDDPIWPILAELDGRDPHKPPGQSYSRPTTAGQKSPPPFMSDDSQPPEEAETSRTAAQPLLAGLNRDLLDWLLLVLPDISRHLLAALGLAETADMAAQLLSVNGRLHVTNTHVDLVMSLDSISLAVRQAGLDFDPGWVPSFGRIIQFHYE